MKDLTQWPQNIKFTNVPDIEVLENKSQSITTHNYHFSETLYVWINGGRILSVVCGLLFDREAERKVSEWQGTLDEQHPETQPTPVAPKVPSKPWTDLSSIDRTRILTWM